MPRVDLADDSFIVADRARTARRLRDPAVWAQCWPRLRLTPYHDRGDEGVRWYVIGELVGTAELWLERYRDGTLVHVFLRADPETGRRRARSRPYAVALKRMLFAVKDELERGREVGTPGPAPGPTRGSTAASGASTGESNTGGSDTGGRGTLGGRVR